MSHFLLHIIGKVGIILPTGAGNAGVTQFLLGVNDASYLDNRFADCDACSGNLKYHFNCRTLSLLIL